jgi:hypothetical protein
MVEEIPPHILAARLHNRGVLDAPLERELSLGPLCRCEKFGKMHVLNIVNAVEGWPIRERRDRWRAIGYEVYIGLSGQDLGVLAIKHRVHGVNGKTTTDPPRHSTNDPAHQPAALRELDNPKILDSNVSFEPVSAFFIDENREGMLIPNPSQSIDQSKRERIDAARAFWGNPKAIDPDPHA